MSFVQALTGIKEAAKTGGDIINKISEQKTGRMNIVRGWAGPIVFILSALPFIYLLWVWVFSASIKELEYVSENAINIVNTIGAKFFFGIVSVLLTGSAGGIGYLSKKKMEIEAVKHKETQETIRTITNTNELFTPFEEAFKKTLGHEGGYVCDPDDTGGETYKGISRNNWPSWEGWKIIDKAKRPRRKFPKCLDTNEKLTEEVQEFYKGEFWDKLKGDEVAAKSRMVAIELFDTAVNCGHKRAIKFLQRSLTMNGYGFYGKVLDDGKIGDLTLNALDVVLPKYESQIVKGQNGEQYTNYVRIVKRRPANKKFFRGWLKRI
jgi:lysozyme family protein